MLVKENIQNTQSTNKLTGLKIVPDIVNQNSCFENQQRHKHYLQVYNCNTFTVIEVNLLDHNTCRMIKTGILINKHSSSTLIEVNKHVYS